MAINKAVVKRTDTHGAMRNCIEYVLQEQKIKNHLVTVTGPYPYEEINYDLVYRTFLEEKRLWDKDSGRMYAHNIISWHKDEAITPEQAFQFGVEFTEKWFQGFQTLISIHQDKNHIHCHMVTNSVSYENGKKLHSSRKDLERMKQMTNRMCRERGLTVADKGKHFDGTPIEKGEVIAWNKDKYNLFKQETKDSYVAVCAMAVLSAMEHSTNREEFIKKMKNAGWEVNWTDKRKHITFQNQDGKKVRDSNLSKTFHLPISKGELEDEFIRNERKQHDAIGGEPIEDGELGQYYRQLEEVIAGTGGGDNEVDFGEGRLEETVSQDSGTLAETSGEAGEFEIRKSADVIRESRAARRTSEHDRGTAKNASRVVENAETQSVLTAEQRRFAEQERIAEQERARAARRRNRRCSDPEL